MTAVSDPQAYRAALYIRLSREDERDGPSQSVTNQRTLLTEYAQASGIPVYDVYIDDGWSGTSFDRPAFGRMIADIEAGRVNMVITKDLSRLGRDYIMTGHYMERYFPERRVRYISLLDGVDTGVESMANDITPFRAIMNDMYAKDISRKILSVKHDKQKKGLFIGGRPVYGYRMHPQKPNAIVPDRPAAANVQRIFALAAQGMSCRAIALQLSDEGIPAPSVYAGMRRASGRWSPECISRMLQNPVYTGAMVQGRRKKVSYKSKKCVRLPREQWIVVGDTHEPLIDDKTFALVQRQIAARRHTRSRKYDFLLKGMIVCRECGAPLSAIRRQDASGLGVLYLVCRTHQRDVRACVSHCIRESDAAQAVMEAVKAVCTGYMDIGRLSGRAKAGMHGSRDAVEACRQAIRRRLDTMDAGIGRLCRDRLEGTVEEEDFVRICGEMKRERQALRERKDALESCAGEGGFAVMAGRFLQSAFSGGMLLGALLERAELAADGTLYLRFRCRPPAEDEGMR